MEYFELVDLVYNEAIFGQPNTTQFQIPHRVLCELDIGSTLGRVGNGQNGRTQIEVLNGNLAGFSLYPLSFNQTVNQGE